LLELQKQQAKTLGIGSEFFWGVGGLAHKPSPHPPNTFFLFLRGFIRTRRKTHRNQSRRFIAETTKRKNTRRSIKAIHRRTKRQRKQCPEKGKKHENGKPLSVEQVFHELLVLVDNFANSYMKRKSKKPKIVDNLWITLWITCG
jgi:hypothetical protein